MLDVVELLTASGRCIVLDFDHDGRVVGLRVTGAADSILAPRCSTRPSS